MTAIKILLTCLLLMLLCAHLNAQIIYDNGPIIDNKGEKYSLVGSKWNKSILYYYIQVSYVKEI